MSLEERLNALEIRLRAAEDQLEIMRLLNVYGPLVDSGQSTTAATLWTEDGVYEAGGIPPMRGRAAIVGMLEGATHHELMRDGSSHLTAPPAITVSGDTAEAVGYSQVIRKEGESWVFFRASINHWRFARTPKGWRIVARTNRLINGSPESQDLMRRAKS